jgi:hypothetical protein
MAKFGNELFELLAKYGLRKPDDLDRVYRLSSKKARDLQERLFGALLRLQYEGLPPEREAHTFRFVASRHLRGDACDYCRPAKLELIGRFAALYSDVVIVPLSLSHPSKNDSPADGKYQTRNAAEALLLLRPLILAGIVRLAVMTTRNCCQFHANNLREFADLTHSIAEDMASGNLGRFSLYYEPPPEPGGIHTVHLEGPRYYLDHGRLYWHLSRPPSWVAKSWRPEPDGRFKVPPQKLRRSGLVQSLFGQIASDTTFHFAYGSLWKAKYLTDLPGEAELLRGLGNDGPSAQQHRSTALVSAMTHALPFVGDLAIPEILKIRSEISESFEQYRWAIAAIIREHGAERLNTQSATRICATELAPRIAILENKIAIERRRFNSKVIATSGIVGVVVMLGMFGLMQPSQGCDLLGGALTVLAGMLAESRSPSPESAKDDLYFLLRLKQAGGRTKVIGH